MVPNSAVERVVKKFQTDMRVEVDFLENNCFEVLAEGVKWRVIVVECVNVGGV